ncbi:hypothetical protein NDU88_005338 [Pleurodeles waltl]|uniref:Uncharacterized protein n=1 Tax=Pleurodeles waltl TaxID=8319 RepID=A0AAV7WA54_PLEWA|nr:hypothetical protein NDU88_005338 [Pleurodeles waltl]
MVAQDMGQAEGHDSVAGLSSAPTPVAPQPLQGSGGQFEAKGRLSQKNTEFIKLKMAGIDNKVGTLMCMVRNLQQSVDRILDQM